MPRLSRVSGRSSRSALLVLLTLFALVAGALTGLTPASAEPTSAVTGLVTDGVGVPIGGVHVTVEQGVDNGDGTTSWTVLQSATTASDGRYAFAVPAGTYKVSFAAATYVSGYYTAPEGPTTPERDLSPAVVVPPDAELGATRLESTFASIRGVLTDADGHPAPGVRISVESRSTDSTGQVVWTEAQTVPAITGADGSYVATVPGGRYKVGFHAKAWVEEWYDDSPTREQGDNVRVAAGDIATGIDAVLEPAPAVLRGRATTSGDPLGGTRVTVEGVSPGAPTLAVTNGADGTWTVTVPAGTYRVGFQLVGYDLQWFDDSETAAGATPVVVTPGDERTGLDAALDLGTSTISGRVTSQETGQPLQGVRVVVLSRTEDRDGVTRWTESQLDPARTDAQGDYTATVGSGTYRIGYRLGSYGERWFGNSTDRDQGDDLTLAPRQARGDVDVRLGAPLADVRWGIYHGDADQAWRPYLGATPAQRALLEKIVEQPKAQWFGNWIGNSEIAGKVRMYIDNATAGDPDTLVQMALFRMNPWEGDACHRLPTAAEKKSYKDYVDRFARAIGDAKVALILQPDGPFARCAPGGSKVNSHLIRYSAQVLSRLPRTAVYIDAGADDWLKSDPAEALQILLPAGVDLVRGFAFNSTHYDDTGANVRFGAAVVAALEKRGIHDKHFVINTSSNGAPFPGYSYEGPNFNNAWVCKHRGQKRCVTLGIPPTLDVDSGRWGLTAEEKKAARSYVDAFLWFGRPWLQDQKAPFVMDRALQLVRTSPYF